MKKLHHPVCPYCGSIFETPPTRKRKCPYCRNTIYIRDGEIVTEERAGEIDREYAARYEFDKWVGRVRSNGIDEALLDRRMTARSMTYRDAVWSLLNERLISIMNTNNWSAMKMLYLTMAEIRAEANKEFQSLQRQAAECELRDYKQSRVVTKVKILTAGDSACNACRQQEGMVYTIGEAMQKKPIPHLACTTAYGDQAGWCRCSYLPIVDG